MAKKKLFLVLDTETATLPMANEIANGNAEIKKKIAIAKPLIYDFAYCLVERNGNIIDRKQFLVAEIFSVPSIFNTAYYAEKRPIYLKMLSRGETSIRPWNEIMEIFIEDMQKVDAVGAFNSMFDYKKAISFTELYINMLYSPNYYQWEEIQRKSCRRIAFEKPSKNPEHEFDGEHFRFRGIDYDLFDLWGLATTYLLDNTTYKNQCLKYNMLTASGVYFKTSAETSYRYLCDKYDFIESHTALDDAVIESYILHKIAQKHAITPGIKFFPFRDLGYTYDHCMRRKTPNTNECRAVYDAMAAYVDSKIAEAKQEAKEISSYTKGILDKMERVAAYAGLPHNYAGV